MFRLLQHFALSLMLIAPALAQTSFTVFPKQVVTGLRYTIAWDSVGQPTTLELTRAGRVIALLAATNEANATVNTFEWEVDDDYTSGTDYGLKLGAGSRSSIEDIWIIDDDDGLVVSGSTVRTAAPTATIDPNVARTMTSIYVHSTVTLSTGAASNGILPATQTAAAGTPAPTAHHGPSGGGIAAIVLGILGILLLFGGGVWWFLRRRRARAAAANSIPEADFGGSHQTYDRSSWGSSTAKGTLYGGSDMVGDKYELNNTGVVGSPELPGSTVVPWNEEKQMYASETGIDKKPSTTPGSITHELPGDSGQRN